MLFEQKLSNNSRLLPEQRDLIEKFLGHLTLKPSSIDSYFGDLAQYTLFIEAENEQSLVNCPAKRLQKLTSQFLSSFAPASARRKRSVIVGFLESFRPESWAQELPIIPNRAAKTKHLVPLEFVALLLNSPKVTARAKALIACIFYGHVGADELRGLTLAKSFDLPGYGLIKPYLDDYTRNHRPTSVSRGLFISHQGTTLSRQAMWGDLKEASIAANIPVTVNIQALFAAGVYALHTHGWNVIDIRQETGLAEDSVCRIIRSYGEKPLMKGVN